MSRAARSVQAFGFYLVGLGIALAVVPNLLLGAFGLPATPEVWIRVVGVLVLNIGIYYLCAAADEARRVFRVSVHTRALVLIAFLVFVLLGFASPRLVLFGAVDLAGGLWTLLALRRDAAGTRTP